MGMNYSQPGIYNALDDLGAGFGMRKQNSGGQNAAAFQAAIDYALQRGGGIVIIPSNDGTASTRNYYPILPASGTVAVTIPGSGYQSAPLLICGTGGGADTGGGTTLRMEGSGDLFDINSNGNVFFEDLTVEYLQSENNPLTGSAFKFSGGQNYGLFRVLIKDCQYPVKFNGTTQSYMEHCWIHYVNYPVNDQQELRAVQIDGVDTMIANCLLQFNATAESNHYGIVIGGVSSSSGTRIRSTQVESFYNGIKLQSTAGQTATSLFTNVRVESPPGGTCLAIGPTIYDARFTGCHFQNPDGNMNQAQNVVIDPGTSGNASVDTVTFESCTSKTAVDYGIQIKGGQNVQILGGTYSGNAIAGIGVTGGASEIQIDGANCLGISWPSGGNNRSEPQQYGIYIIAGQQITVVGVTCSGTGRTGLPGTGIYISGSTIADVRIIAAVCSGPAFGNASMQQYGLYVQGASGVTIAYASLTGNTSYGLYLLSVTDVTISACDVFGNGNTSGGGIYLDGGQSQSARVFIGDCSVTGYTSPLTPFQFANSLSQIEIANCAGYSDIGTIVSTSVPGNNQPFHGYDSGSGYYGPVVFYCSGSSVQVAINGHATNLSSGKFSLGPADSGTLTYTSAPTFLMIGA
jgi:hypothetical protein